MKTIKLKQLELRNFKGIRNLTIDFDKITNIYGDNATGKTTVFDAFTWLLFGKDSTDRKQFEVKTLDNNNVVIPKLEHEVSAILDVDGLEIEVKRILKEKWVKKRGSLESEFSGNETLYYWQNIPLQAKEFLVKINGLIDEGIFKLITNPKYFNALKWQDCREVLIRITGNITDNEIAQGNDEFIKLITGLKDKTIEEYKREIFARKKKLKTDLITIPTRIDEAFRSMPELIDFTKIKAAITQLENELESVENSILDKSKAIEDVQNKYSRIHQEIFGCKSKVQNIEFEEQQKLNNSTTQHFKILVSLQHSNRFKKEELNTIKTNIKYAIKKRKSLITKTDDLRNDWNTLNAKEIQFNENENEFSCPTCNHSFDADKIEERKKTLTANFQKDKNENLAVIQRDGKRFALEIETLKNTIVSNENAMATLEKEVTEVTGKITALEQPKLAENSTPTLEEVLKTHEEYNQLKAKITELESKIIKPPKVDTSKLQQRKSDLKVKIQENRTLLNDEIVIERTNKRIAELKEEERNLAQQIADLELSEFTINAFIKSKIEILENRINNKFKLVKFRLFETQINGGEIECCDTLINGVPYADLNNAAKINAGLDVINTLCKFYKVNAPVFIDNAESVNELITIQSQLTRLVVTKDKQLKIAL